MAMINVGRQQLLLKRIWRRLRVRRISPSVAIRLLIRSGFRSSIALLMLALVIVAAGIFGLMVLMARASRGFGKADRRIKAAP